MTEWLATPQFWAGAVALLLIQSLPFGFVRLILGRQYRPASATINLPFSLGNITYDVSETERVLAWQLYVQLGTRKAALSFDEEHDVIAEVYDSIYELFPITRDLLMNLPLHEIAKESSVAHLMLRVLNDGLRPHLTKWQAEFHRWWATALSDPANNKRPQDVQRDFPRYGALVDDMKHMNVELTKFAQDLLTIARARPSKAREERPEPTPPSE